MNAKFRNAVLISFGYTCLRRDSQSRLLNHNIQYHTSRGACTTPAVATRRLLKIQETPHIVIGDQNHQYNNDHDLPVMKTGIDEPAEPLLQKHFEVAATTVVTTIESSSSDLKSSSVSAV